MTFGRIRPLFRQQGVPVFQNKVYATREEARECPIGDVDLVQDPATGVVTNAAFQPERMVYDENYQNEQSLSPRFQRHLDRIADLVEAKLGRSDLIELGCGKGYFFEMLRARGCDVRGFDPAYEGDNPLIRKEFYSEAVHAPFSGVILRHVLEHIQDPLRFLADLAVLNEGRGRVYIEVPCFDWILEYGAWFDIFYEHVNYFRMSDFERFFDGLVHAERSFGGQYLTIVADLDRLRPGPYEAIAPVSVPDAFAVRLPRYVREARGPLVVWGASSKGVIFSMLCERNGIRVDRLIDINPAKQGRYIPVTGIRVHGPDEGLDGLPPDTTILVMNGNYAGEIEAAVDGKFPVRSIDDE
jgi:hypothetical protein